MRLEPAVFEQPLPCRQPRNWQARTWSEAGQGDALYDLATFTLGHEEHLDDVIVGYGSDIDRDVIRA